jgi:hypothetical protein
MVNRVNVANKSTHNSEKKKQSIFHKERWEKKKKKGFEV